MKKFVLIINTPIQGGSGNLIRLFMQKQFNAFIINTSKIKFSITGYKDNMEKYRPIVHRASLVLAETMMEEGLSLIVRGGSIKQAEFNENITKIAAKHGAKVVTISVDAPLHILLERFNNDIASAKEKGEERSVTDEAGFMERYDAFMKLKDQGQLQFNTQSAHPDDMFKAVVELLEK